MVNITQMNIALRQLIIGQNSDKSTVVLQIGSLFVAHFLNVLKRNGFIQDYERFREEGKKKVLVTLNGRLSKSGMIFPKQLINSNEIDTWVKVILQGLDGSLILQTKSGLLSHQEAKYRKLCGKLIGFFY